MSFFSELKRRNVFRVAIAYVLIAWLALQFIDFMVELVAAPSWVLQMFFAAAVVGLVGVLIFSWAWEVTPEGIKRESEVDRTQSITAQTGRKLDRVIIVVLALVVVALLGDRFFLDRDRDAAPSMHPAAVDAAQVAALEQRPQQVVAQKSVAVLPFVALSSGPDDGYFADGLTEEILNSLAQLPELLVTGRTSAFAFKGRNLPVQEIADQLRVEHVVEGSVRRSGDHLRVSAQLVRAADGFQLWSDTYDRDTADAIVVQEDIAEKIASALNIVLDDARREAMRRAGLRDVEAFIAYQKGVEASNIAHGEMAPVASLLEANRYFEQVLERVPDNPKALVEHTDAYVHIINDAATNQPLPGLSEEDVANAYAQAVADFSAAVENAHNFDQRAIIEFDLAAISGNLRGIRQRMETILDSEYCDHRSNWIEPLANLFGYAHRLRERLARVRACDPLGTLIHHSEARAALWAGDAEGALSLVAAAEQKLSHPWFDDLTLFSLLALGRHESAASEIPLRFDGERSVYADMTVAAAMGDRRRAESMFRELEADGGDWIAMQHNARIGARDTANHIAAGIDQRAYGPLPLMLVALWCYCGAPFDLEATPRFAAELAEGNLPWPPPEIIDFPLKEW